MRSVSFSAFDAMGGAAPLTGPLRLTVNAVWPWPKSMTEKKRRVAGAHWRTSRPDADNIAKLVGDAMNGVVYADDAQIVSQTVTKQYGLSGATYVLVEEIADGEGNQP